MHIERGEDKVAVNHIAVITGLIGTFPESKTKDNNMKMGDTRFFFFKVEGKGREFDL